MDKHRFESDEATPLAGPLIETLRAVGYDTQTAVADLIDNSISATARRVWLRFNWDGEDSTIDLLDDGCGMNARELINAMRPGSQSPRETRSERDLGRFGLGLKTASFSQCRSLTVISKREDYAICTRSWDLDYVEKINRWMLLEYPVPPKDRERLESLESGTLIRWSNLDRLVKGTRKENDQDLDHFMAIMANVKDHLRMVFHRFLEQGRLTIWLNDRKLAAWDPYLRGYDATQPLPEEVFWEGLVRVRPYVLPHISKLDREAFTQAAGPNGWNAQQGYYIYRNERLLVAGSWLGTFKKEEHCKLARIMIDFPNSMDREWEIDIKKSVARPPAELRGELKRIAKFARSKAQEVYRHRGRVVQRTLKRDFAMVWEERIRHGKRFYKINRDHPAISALQDFDPVPMSAVEKILRLVEESVPVALITLKEAEEPDAQSAPFEHSSSKEMISIMESIYERLLQSGMSPESAKQQLHFIEPFNYYPEFIDSL